MPLALVQFTPFPSLSHPSFWHKLTQLKLDVLKLSDAQVDITGSYGVGRLIRDREAGAWISVNANLAVEEESFTDTKIPTRSVAARGTLKNYNTIEEFKAADKTMLFNECADKIWESIVTNKDTSLLNSFLIITYADLKKYKYYYWFAFPAFVASPSWHITERGWVPAIQAGFSEAQMSSIYEQLLGNQPLQAFFVVLTPSDASTEVTVSAIDAYVPGATVGFIDPSAQLQNPGWPLRNLLAYLRYSYPDSMSSLDVLSWRDTEIPREGWKSRVGSLVVGDGSLSKAAVVPNARPNAVGWEKNVQGKLGPRVADLAPMMDPTRLANQAVDLNLKLMRWRIVPSLDLDKIAATRCLLLGAGTLGCYVARCLMGWGVRTITLVDSARVSFSNPVRQPLFQFSDCLNGGRPKAECAAERLREVWPGLNASGYTLSIPMPGHPIPVSPSLCEQVQQDVEKLEKLIEEHDVVYLLMDSRESRWLPTVIARSKDKLVMNAALGFDTFLVMRHGARHTLDDNSRLGCYYCNDIVAPADSLTDRTLDQMCTVTRPGLASIAASTAVELMVSVLQHPRSIHASASSSSSSNYADIIDVEKTSVLGLVPHQLRGYLAQFRNLHIVGAAYDKCTGCSEIVINAYETEGFSMLLNAFNDSKYLERLTGLDNLFAEGEKALRDVEWIEEEEDNDF
ncbi:E1-like protein-activating [Guyanagaster necrorhizus]|uniref:Ubiquitin-like modifier-activating enzyme ATG7 n=1 Tax=Guyanagaster necrorhizus TaxID=856835 RepID=A0A9P8AYD2_9AGAR|nr:E1-like protein-activating [Guyanagaster necrorhizus MCA 3950]KAG7452779.1 E1-like protein-activating [Guyanagaster necrorhizus MCA 3950]